MRTYVVAAVLIASSGPARAQAPAFEVSSVKPNTSLNQSSSIRVQPGGRVTITNTSLFALIRNAYRREAFEITGGPDWIRSDRWDVVAKAPGDADQPAILAMARTLLRDRFKLVVHNERRDMPVFALVRVRADGRLGPQLQPSAVADCPRTLAEMRARDAAGQSQAANGAPVCTSEVSPGRFVGSARSIAEIVRVLTPLSERTVVDKTGLTGTFDLELTWGKPEDGPSIFTAIQEQLGLKLEPQRGPVDVLVIDSAERPTED